MGRRLIISPSGNFYGSEQVLFDYLTSTAYKSDLLIPEKGILIDSIKQHCPQHTLIPYNPNKVALTYMWIAYKIFIKRYSIVYLNEAGHVKYILLLSKIFKTTRFIIHVRILEDTYKSRWRTALNKNVTTISISRYIQELLPVKSLLLYDGYQFNDDIYPTYTRASAPLRIAIIGRITKSKGLKHLLEVLHLLEKENIQNFHFILFGDISNDISDDELIQSLKNYKNVCFAGFQKEKSEIYKNIDCVFHCSVQEALGRIFLESIDYLKPFIGFDEGGISEIGELVGLKNLLVSYNNDFYPAQVIDNLSAIQNNYTEHVNAVSIAKKKAMQVFSVKNYTAILDSIS